MSNMSSTKSSAAESRSLLRIASHLAFPSCHSRSCDPSPIDPRRRDHWRSGMSLHHPSWEQTNSKLYEYCTYTVQISTNSFKHLQAAYAAWWICSNDHDLWKVFFPSPIFRNRMKSRSTVKIVNFAGCQAGGPDLHQSTSNLHHFAIFQASDRCETGLRIVHLCQICRLRHLNHQFQEHTFSGGAVVQGFNPPAFLWTCWSLRHSTRSASTK